MEYRLQIIKGELYPLGVHRVAAGLSIVSEPPGKEHSGIVLYVDADGRKKEYKIEFKPEYLVNGLYCILLPDFPYSDFEYLYYADGKKITDRNAGLVASSHRFGDAVSGQKTARCCYHEDVFDWENDVSPEIPFQDTIIYKIHMRGFTKHISSNVSAPKSDGKYSLFIVDTYKVPDDVKFYYDPRCEDAFYTKDKIPPEAIQKTMDYDFINDKPIY